jgi:hypothetical protein
LRIVSPILLVHSTKSLVERISTSIEILHQKSAPKSASSWCLNKISA